MGGTSYNGRRQRGRRSRFEVIALLLGLALIVSQAIGVVTAVALTSRDRTGSFTTDTTKVSAKKDTASRDRTGSFTSGTTAVNTSSTAGVSKTAISPASTTSSYDGLSFRLQGCKGSAGLLPNGSGEFICDDSLYTDGNLGKGWNELDLVPHRIIIDAGTSAPAQQTYTFDIAADNLDGGKLGYDYIENGFEAKSAACQNVSIGAQQTVGSNPRQIFRRITVTQDRNTTCQLDLYIRLGLGSHLFPGSSLHSNLLNDSETTAGIGNKENSIPVNAIQPQSISKDMAASQGSDTVWNVTKSSSPASIDFGDTCSGETGSRSANVDITVDWTKATTPSGDITITTHVYATNPAHRVITVNVVDKVYKGTGQGAADLVHTGTSGDVDVAGNTTDFLILSESFTVASGPSQFNDVATATYKDKETGFPVPGSTTASASANVQNGGATSNGTVTIDDVESITGSGLSFSVDSVDGATGAFDNGYALGDVASPGDQVSWTSDPQTDGGSVTFHKTVYFAGPGKTSGSLDDQARVLGDQGAVLDSANASVGISADATVSLTIDKTVPAGVITGSNTQDFVFDVSGPNGYTNQVTLSFDSGTTQRSTTITGLEPGTYTVTEETAVGWQPQLPKAVDIGLPSCSGTVSFANTPVPLGIQIVKGGPALAHVGDTITYTFDVSLTTPTPLTDITVTDPICNSAPTLDSKSGGNQDAWLEPGETWHYSCTHVVTATDPDPLPNTATVTGTDDQGRQTSDTDDHLVDIIHPAIQIVKTANPTSITPGETVTYTYAVTNTGDVPLFNVSVDDDKLGHICDIAKLAVGETQTCTKDFTAGDTNVGPIKNVAVAEGEDETGYPVRDSDTAAIDVVLGTTVTPPPTTTPPGGTAFTGSNEVLPLGGLALLLLVIGSGLLYLGRRRGDGSEA